MGLFHPTWFGGRMPAALDKYTYGDQQDGWLCENKIVAEDALVRAPDHLTFEEAATLPCAALTAWTALSGPAPIRSGQSVLVQGTGGVSIFALQLARVMGATVFATTSSDAKAERLRDLGAADVVNYISEPAWGKKIRGLAGGSGVDRVVEVGGPGTIHQSLRAVAPEGEIASVGVRSTENPGLDFSVLKRSAASFRNVAVGDRVGLEALCRAVSASGLRPIIDRVFTFDRARDALEHLMSGAHFGKVVVQT